MLAELRYGDALLLWQPDQRRKATSKFLLTNQARSNHVSACLMCKGPHVFGGGHLRLSLEKFSYTEDYSTYSSTTSLAIMKSYPLLIPVIKFPKNPEPRSSGPLDCKQHVQIRVNFFAARLCQRRGLSFSCTCSHRSRSSFFAVIQRTGNTRLYPERWFERLAISTTACR